MNYINNEFIIENKIIDIPFQTKLLEEIKYNSGIIIAPTGSGKSIIALRLCLNYLKITNKKILFMTPTVILTEQQYTLFKNLINKDIVGILTANDKNRLKEYNTKQIIFSTPHIISNELEYKNIKFDDVALIIFDEVHNLYNEYPYQNILQNAVLLKIIGMTASPGNEEELSNLQNLLNFKQIFYANPPRPKIIHKPIFLNLPQNILNILSKLKNLANVLSSDLEEEHTISLENLHNLKKKLVIDKNYALLRIVYKLMSLKYLTYIFSTQDIKMAQKYIQDKPTKYSELKSITQQILKLKEIQNLKLKELIKILKEQISKNLKGIVFIQYRFVIDLVYSELKKINLKVGILVGQNKGLKKEQQKNAINEINSKKIDVLLSTSVGEEGLDISQLNYIVMYSPTSNLRKHIQRTGRTGRQKTGQVFYLIYKDTSDIINYSLINKFKIKEN